MARHQVARISPISTGLLIYGIVMAALLPPLAPAFLLASWLVQRRYRSDALAGRRHREAAQAAKIERAQAKARRDQLEAAYRMGSL